MRCVRSPNRAYLYPIVFAFSTLVFGIYSQQTFVIEELVRYDLCGQEVPFDDDDGKHCDEEEVARITTRNGMYCGFATSIPVLFVAGPMSSLSKTCGRRFPAAIVVAGICASYLLMAAITQFNLRAEYVIASNFLQGVTGFYFVFLMFSSTYIADLNDRDRLRLTSTDVSDRFSFAEAMVTLGVVVGPLGAAVIDKVGVGFPQIFIGSAGLCLLFTVYLLFVLPDTVVPGAPKSESEEDPSSPRDDDDQKALASFFDIMRLAFSVRRLPGGAPVVQGLHLQEEHISRHPPPPEGYEHLGRGEGTTTGTKPTVSAVNLARISLAFMLSFGSTSALSFVVLYANYKWEWGGAEDGIFFSAYGFVSSIAMLLLRRMSVLVFRKEIDDRLMMKLGAAGAILFNITFAVKHTELSVYCLLPLVALQFVATPSYRAFFSNCYGPEDQAAIFGAVSVLEVIPTILAPLVYNQVFSFTLSSCPEAVFYLLAAVSGVALYLIWNSETTLAAALLPPPCADGNEKGNEDGA